MMNLVYWFIFNMEGYLMKLENNINKNITEIRECKQCGRSLDKDYNDDLCPACKEMNLFAEVKEYIRLNDVKEMDVARHFDIPISKVRKWIKQGRIEYKMPDGKTVSGVKCRVCGKKIEFGIICPECLRRQKLKVIAKQEQSQPEEMRFLGERQADSER